jgi:ATP-dependent RNA helicase SUPV3L1/SUV3
VLESSKALEAANASGDAQKIKAAMAALDAALHGQAQAAAAVAAAGPALVASAGEAPAAEAAAPATESAAPDAPGASDDGASDEPKAEDEAAPAAAPVAPAKPAPKPVIAMRGDDRPGMKKAEPMPAGRGGKFGDRKGGPGGKSGAGGKFGERRDDRAGGTGAGRFGDRPAFEDRGPRLGDVAFRAQREALEHAQLTLKKLAAQAHGEALTQLMTAWEQRAADQVPTLQELGKAVTPAVRSSWTQAVGAAPSGDASEPLLRLEIAAEAPTPAEHLNARRALQLQLLTRRNDPSPAQTWGQDTARVLSSAYEAGAARRLQGVLKTLLRR